MRKFLFYLGLIITTIITGCNKIENNGSLLSDYRPSDILSEGALEYIDAQPSVNVDLGSVILPNEKNLIEFAYEYDYNFVIAHQYLYNGYKVEKYKINKDDIGPQVIKNKIIQRVTAIANYYANDNNFPDDGAIPIQKYGLCYSWGSKKTQRLVPPGYAPCSCKEPVFGLDCSGYVWLTLKDAGLYLCSPEQACADYLRQVTTIKKALISMGSEYSKISIKNFNIGEISSSEFEDGDIIYFIEPGKSTASHIGMICKEGNLLKLFQSNGSPYNSCEDNCKANKGPRAIGLLDPMNWKDKKGNKIFSSYGIVRLVTDISGSWALNARCSGQTTDAMQINLTIPINNGGDFSAYGSGYDYDGDILNAVIHCTYDKKTNILSGYIVWNFPEFPDQNREDSFTVKLYEDNTGYFATTKVIDNTGCNLEICLINNETKSTKSFSNDNKNVKGINISK